MSILKGSEDILSKSDEAYNSAFLGADLELDGSRRREISLYKNDEVVLTVEHGVTLGLLKLIYSSDSTFQGVLQGVRSRPSSDQSPVTSVIVSDDRVLDRDEYELIIQDQPIQASILQQTIATPLPLQSSTIPLPPPPPSSSIFLTNSNNGDKKIGQFVCEYCHLPFVSKAKFLRHRRIHTEENPYVCVYCNETFSHHMELRKHRDEHHMTNKSFKCNYCPKTFATRAELKGHLWRHTGEKNHKCRICGKTFATKGNLKLHIDKHIGVHKHKCPFCAQRFTSHSSLEAHMAKHTGMKAYKCRFCPKSYAQAGQLTSHERLHTGEKPFICQVCGKDFRLNSTRLAHEKRHSGTRPHICDTCGRSFGMPDHLRRHLKTHENKLDRLVSCPFCKKKIFAGRNMRKHLARHRELNLTETQAKAISATLKPDRELNERDSVDDDQRSIASESTKLKQVIRCIECNEEVKSMRKLIDHLSDEHYHRELTPLERKEIRLRHGLQKLHHCQFCSSYFIDYRLLRSHVLAEHPEHAEDVGFVTKSGGGRRNTNTTTHKCPNCPLFFHLRAALDDHIIRDHLSTFIEFDQENDSVLEFRCWYCSHSFGTPEEVVTHMTKQHESLDVLSKRVEMTDNADENEISSSGIWACTHCPVTLKSEDDYRNHLAQHTPESSTLVRPRQSETDEANSYLNPMDLGSSSYSDDCVMKKYLKADTSISSSTHTTSKLNDATAASTISRNDTTMAALGTIAEERFIVGNSILTSATPLSTDHVLSNGVKNASKKSKERMLSMLNVSDAPTSENVINETTSDLDLIVIRSDTPVSVDVENVDAKAAAVISNASSISTETVGEVVDTEQYDAINITKKLKKKKKFKIKKEKAQNTKDSTDLKMSGFMPSMMESCRFCSDVFKDKTSLYSHIKAAHANEDGGCVPFRCWFCATTFSSPEEVVAHMTNEHDNLDNLSRRIEVTELKNQLAAEKDSCKLKMFKRSADASLSPVDSFRCPKCPKKLESKEAYELHMIVHEASHNTDLLKTGTELFNRNRSIERTNSTTIDEVSLTDEPMEIESSANNFPSCMSSAENFEFTRPALVSTGPTSTIDTVIAAVSIKDTPESVTTSKQKVNTNKTRESRFTAIVAKSHLQKRELAATKSLLKKIKKAKEKADIQIAATPVQPEKQPTPKKSTTKTIIIDGGLNMAVNMCTHCSRAFCGKKALDVHTLKMHGREYLQKQPPPRSSSPFTCWFCSAHFTSPELVVEHMTNAHENLDTLSKRVEDQEIPVFPLNNASMYQEKIISSKQTDNTANKFASIAPQKQVIPLPANTMNAATTVTSENTPQAPPGFKMSYALAYVPIFIPDKNENENTEGKK